MSKICIIISLLVSGFGAYVQAGMTGDTITSILHTAYAGTWTNASAVVGPGVEYSRSFLSSDPATISLDVSDTSFTLTYDNTHATAFNLGLDGFEFTDPSQFFAGIKLASNTGGLTDYINDITVTETNIHITMNEPQIPGLTTWTATWNVIFGPKLSISTQGTNIVLSWPEAAVGYKLQRQFQLNSTNWTDVVTSTNQAIFPATNSVQFFRLSKQ